MSWLDRQGFLGAQSENVLAARRIGIAGLGGGGSHVAQQLAHVGIKSFVIADKDAMEDNT
jgi:tRNA A37 threonylcarbamoyladenosine dehydratase